ncbi:hypothetical protein HX882_31930 [Pseudomonas gingeri]|uniref:Uncharacterized protein n=1 Tax=Pseudomonas gingeri TaxID=117681 RepID=A0A7Y7XIG8_9PSED|nr:hypothetical protein [Pseudomonas gingeri]NWC00494.1 hypothetical protein [Pseudomonas gingeri]
MHEMPSPKSPSDQVSDDADLHLDAPTVPAVLDPNDPEGLLPSRALGAPLAVEFMGWDFSIPGRTDRVELGFRLSGTAFLKVDEQNYPINNPIDIDFPQTLYVPVNKLTPDGLYDVSIMVYRAGFNGVESPKRQVTIDTREPNYGQIPNAIIFPVDANGVITEDYLNSHAQEVNCLVPYYPDAKEKDRAIYYWTDTSLPSDLEVEVGEQEFSALDVSSGVLRVTFTGDQIRPWGSGVRYAYYRLRDRAGNTGPRSRLSPIDVNLTPIPGTLPPPRVELTRGLLDRQQARDSVWVEIDQYAGADDTNWIAVVWDGTPLPEFPVDITRFPLKAPVDWAVLKAQGMGPLRAKVDYRVRTAPGVYTPASTDISVPVNLTIAGQDHAAAPGLINVDLELLEVWGQSPLLNVLTALDDGLDATARVTLFDDPHPFEEILLYWGRISQPVGSYTVQPGDIAGKIVSIPVPWSAIEQDKNNPTLPVYYVTSNGVNEQQSLVTEVNVLIETIQGLPAPTFPSTNPVEGYLHCCSVPRLWDGVRVAIAGNANFSAGDTVLLIWQGSKGLNGSQPIKGARGTFTKVLNDADARGGFEVLVEPYDPLIEPMIDNDSATVFYRLIKANGGIGVSEMDFVKINRTLPSGEVCGPLNDLCPPEQE